MTPIFLATLIGALLIALAQLWIRLREAYQLVDKREAEIKQAREHKYVEMKAREHAERHKRDYLQLIHVLLTKEGKGHRFRVLQHDRSALPYRSASWLLYDSKHEHLWLGLRSPSEASERIRALLAAEGEDYRKLAHRVA